MEKASRMAIVLLGACDNLISAGCTCMLYFLTLQCTMAASTRQDDVTCMLPVAGCTGGAGGCGGRAAGTVHRDAAAAGGMRRRLRGAGRHLGPDTTPLSQILHACCGVRCARVRNEGQNRSGRWHGATCVMNILKLHIALRWRTRIGIADRAFWRSQLGVSCHVAGRVAGVVDDERDAYPS